MLKKGFVQYIIDIPKLKEGSNSQNFAIDSSFFSGFENSLISEGYAEIQAIITKFQKRIEVLFTYSGFLMLECDRCLEPFKYVINGTKKVIYSYEVLSSTKSENEVIYLTPTETKIDLSQDIYDFISLEMPVKKIAEVSVHTCPEEINNLIQLEEELIDSSDPENLSTDPRWEALKKLKNSDQT